MPQTALAVAAPLREQTHSRLRQYAEWLTQAEEEIASERRERETERDEHLAEARRLFEADELEGAVRVIGQVPVALRTEDFKSLEEQIEWRNHELAARVKACQMKSEPLKRSWLASANMGSV